MPSNKFPTLIELKSEVKELHKLMKLADPSLKLGHVYDQVSKKYGFNNWNHMAKLYLHERIKK